MDVVVFVWMISVFGWFVVVTIFVRNQAKLNDLMHQRMSLIETRVRELEVQRWRKRAK